MGRLWQPLHALRANFLSIQSDFTSVYVSDPWSGSGLDSLRPGANGPDELAAGHPLFPKQTMGGLGFALRSAWLGRMTNWRQDSLTYSKTLGFVSFGNRRHRAARAGLTKKPAGLPRWQARAKAFVGDGRKEHHEATDDAQLTR